MCISDYECLIFFSCGAEVKIECVNLGDRENLDSLVLVIYQRSRRTESQKNNEISVTRAKKSHSLIFTHSFTHWVIHYELCSILGAVHTKKTWFHSKAAYGRQEDEQ